VEGLKALCVALGAWTEPEVCVSSFGLVFGPTQTPLDRNLAVLRHFCHGLCNYEPLDNAMPFFWLPEMDVLQLRVLKQVPNYSQVFFPFEESECAPSPNYHPTGGGGCRGVSSHCQLPAINSASALQHVCPLS
jgi:hypothetical protein